MDLGFQWVNNLFGGAQNPLTFGAQQVQLQNYDGPTIDCSMFLNPTPDGFEGTSLAMVRDNLAVMPADWEGAGILKPFYSIESHDTVTECMSQIQDSSFVAFDEELLNFIGKGAKVETVLKFEGEHADHVHEAPVYVPSTNELVFADTSVVGWLWGLDVDSLKTRRINTNPPLPNVNGATLYKSNLYLTTNGGHSPGIYNCTLPKGTSTSTNTSEPETINCHAILNNFNLRHLNSPNDLIFTSDEHSTYILFTDPTYGWAQSWSGVKPPELPTAIYAFDTHTKALITLDNTIALQPNGLALSADQKTLFVADSNSTSGKPIGVWPDSVRNVWAWDFLNIPRSTEGHVPTIGLRNPRLVHVVDSGWPDGLRATRYSSVGPPKDVLLVACMGGVDVVDVSDSRSTMVREMGAGAGAGRLLGKINVGDDIVFNLEPVVKDLNACEDGEGRLNSAWADNNRLAESWLLTGKKGVYRFTLGERHMR